MASSSTHSTETEAILRQTFKTTFAWLWINKYHFQAEHTGQLFADALEMRWPELLDMLKPGIDLGGRVKGADLEGGGGRFRSGSEFWARLQMKRNKSFKSEQIALAGDALSDAAAALVRVGREEEAKGFTEWSECVWNVAKMEQRREEGGG